MRTDKEKDIEDLQKLHDNPDEKHASSNYGDIQSYKEMIMKKIAKRKGEENNESSCKRGPSPDGEWLKHRNKKQKRTSNGKERMRAKKEIQSYNTDSENEESFDEAINTIMKKYAL